MAKKSYREIMEFNGVSQQLLGRKVAEAAEKKEKLKETKLDYALRKMQRRCQRHIDEYNEKVGEIQIDECEVDEKTKIILNDERGNLRYTKDGMKNRNKKTTELLDTQVEIEPHYVDAAEIPDDALTLTQIDVFEGFVIRPQDDPPPAKKR